MGEIDTVQCVCTVVVVFSSCCQFICAFVSVVKSGQVSGAIGRRLAKAGQLLARRGRPLVAACLWPSVTLLCLWSLSGAQFESLGEGSLCASGSVFWQPKDSFDVSRNGADLRPICLCTRPTSDWPPFGPGPGRPQTVCGSSAPAHSWPGRAHRSCGPRAAGPKLRARTSRRFGRAQLHIGASCVHMYGRASAKVWRKLRPACQRTSQIRPSGQNARSGDEVCAIGGIWRISAPAHCCSLLLQLARSPSCALWPKLDLGTNIATKRETLASLRNT